MTVVVNITDDNSASVLIPGDWPPDTNFHVFCRNTADNLYLGRKGWTSVATPIPADVSLNADGLTLRIESDAVSHIRPGSRLIVEDIFISMSQELHWPELPKVPETPSEVIAPAPVIEKSDTIAPAVLVIPSEGVPQALPVQKVRGPIWLLATATFLLGVGAFALMVRLAPGSAALLLPQTSVPSPELQQREAKLTIIESNFTRREDALRYAQTTVASVAALQAKREAEINDLQEKVAGQQATQAEREQLRNRVKTLEDDLRKSKERLDASLASVAPSSQSSKLQGQIQVLQKQVDELRLARDTAVGRALKSDVEINERDSQIKDLKTQLAARPSAAAPSGATYIGDGASKPSQPTYIGDGSSGPSQTDQQKADHSILQRRISEQEKVLAGRDKEIASLRDQLAEQKAVSSAAVIAPAVSLSKLETELADAQRVTDDLRGANQELQARLLAQSQTISSWAVDRTATTNRIRELEKELALRISTAPATPVATAVTETSAPSGARWLGAAVNAAGSVEVVTGQDNEEAAKTAATQKCRQTGRSCQLIGAYQDMCFSVARPEGQAIMPANYWFMQAENRTAAQRGALADCDQNSGAYCATAFTMCASD